MHGQFAKNAHATPHMYLAKDCRLVQPGSHRNGADALVLGSTAPPCPLLGAAWSSQAEKGTTGRQQTKLTLLRMLWSVKTDFRWWGASPVVRKSRK